MIRLGTGNSIDSTTTWNFARKSWHLPVAIIPEAKFPPDSHFIGKKGFHLDLPSGYVKIAIENYHLWWIFPLKMVIFHSYVSLPKGI
jgi:hypothetical protein